VAQTHRRREDKRESRQTNTHTQTHRHARERNELKYTHRSHNKTAVEKKGKKKGGGDRTKKNPPK